MRFLIWAPWAVIQGAILRRRHEPRAPNRLGLPLSFCSAWTGCALNVSQWNAVIIDCNISLWYYIDWDLNYIYTSSNYHYWIILYSDIYILPFNLGPTLTFLLVYSGHPYESFLGPALLHTTGRYETKKKLITETCEKGTKWARISLIKE